MSQQISTQTSQPGSIRPFLTIWTGQVFSLLGSHLTQFALVWWLTARTGSATVLAFATLAGLLPQIFLSPVAGVLVDRWNRRQVMIAADGGIALATVVLAVLFAFDQVQVWQIYLLLFARSLGAAFHWPAMQSSTSLMVPEKHLSRIAGLNQALFGLANIVAPPLGALLLNTLAMSGILAIDIGTAALAITLLLFVAVPDPKRGVGTEGGAQAPPVLADLQAGLRLAWSWPGLLALMGMSTLINLLLQPAMTLLPILATTHFGGGAMQLAWLEAAWGVGVVSGGILLGLGAGLRSRMVTAAVGLVAMGMGFLLIGFTPPTALALALGALLLAGAMNTTVNGSVFAALQATVPAETQGRIFTLLMSGAAAMTPLGLIVAGPLADAFGAHVWFVAGGMLTLLLGAGSFLVPALRYFEEWGVPAGSQRPAAKAASAEGQASITAA